MLYYDLFSFAESQQNNIHYYKILFVLSFIERIIEDMYITKHIGTKLKVKKSISIKNLFLYIYYYLL